VTFQPGAGASLTRTASIGLSTTNGNSLVPLAGSVVAGSSSATSSAASDSAANPPASGGGGALYPSYFLPLLLPALLLRRARGRAKVR